VSPGTHKHLDGEEIENYSLGRLSEEELAPCEEHLLICEPCRRQVEASDAYIEAMRQAAAEIRSAPKEPGRR
jgi:anti-sigma factor RsiW